MIIEHKNDLELEGESNNAVEATIAQENLSFIIELISKQIYRDPIGSIVREITSNCFDSHAEAGVDDAVTIYFNSDSEGEYIVFKDVGIGMSPDRIKNVFLSYGASTKRTDVAQIGGFGLGGKSPLSYADYFYITTVYDKIEYQYIVHKGERLPTIELLFQEEKDVRNGTEIKIYFREQYDNYKFMDACEKQLKYFDNVYFKNTWRFNNDYQIYEANNFKLRSDTNKLNNLKESNNYSEYVHLCIGKVAYPIDYNILGRDPVRIPIALKFEVGELAITPERESVRYVKVNGREAKDIINEKLDAAIKEIKGLYDNQASLECATIAEYLDLRGKDPILQIKEVELNLKGIVENKIRCMSLAGYYGKVTQEVFSTFKFRYNIYKRSGRGRKDFTLRLSTGSLEDPDKYISDTMKHNPTKNEYLLLNHRQIEVGTIELAGIKALYKESGLSKAKLPYHTNKLQQIKLLENALEREIRSSIKNYEDVEISQQWLDSRKAKKVVRNEDQIVVYDIAEPSVSHRKKFCKAFEVERFTGFVVFGFDDDIDYLEGFASLFRESKYNTADNKRLSQSKAVKIIKISMINYKKYFKTYKNCVYVMDFIGDNRVFKHFATSLAIRKERKYIVGATLNKSNTLEKIMPHIYPEFTEKFDEIDDFVDTYRGGTITEEFKHAIVDTAHKYNLLDKEIYQKHLDLNAYINRLELLEVVFIVDKYIPHIVDFLVLKGKPVLEIWTKPEQYEIELINESIDKGTYLLETVDQDEQDCKETLTIFQLILNYHAYAKGN